MDQHSLVVLTKEINDFAPFLPPFLPCFHTVQSERASILLRTMKDGFPFIELPCKALVDSVIATVGRIVERSVHGPASLDLACLLVSRSLSIGGGSTEQSHELLSVTLKATTRLLPKALKASTKSSPFRYDSDKLLSQIDELMTCIRDKTTPHSPAVIPDSLLRSCLKHGIGWCNDLNKAHTSSSCLLLVRKMVLNAVKKNEIESDSHRLFHPRLVFSMATSHSGFVGALSDTSGEPFCATARLSLLDLLVCCAASSCTESLEIEAVALDALVSVYKASMSQQDKKIRQLLELLHDKSVRSRRRSSRGPCHNQSVVSNLSILLSHTHTLSLSLSMCVSLSLSVCVFVRFSLSFLFGWTNNRIPYRRPRCTVLAKRSSRECRQPP